MTTTVTPDQSSYIELIRTNPDFRNLWFAQLISAAGNWFNNVALLGLTLQLTNSGFATGLLLLVNQFPFFMWIPIAGPIIDRFDRKKVMIISNYVGAAAALVFLLVHSADMVWLIYVGIVVLSSSTAFFNPAATAIVPNLVDERELYPANTLSGSTWGIMVLIGSAVGGLISAEFGREVVFWINSATFLVANLFLWPVKHTRSVPLDIGQPEKRSTWQDFKDGLAYVRTRPMVMILVACKSGLGLEGGVLILFTIFAEQIFKAGDSGVGWLYASRGLGSFSGAILDAAFCQPASTLNAAGDYSGFYHSGAWFPGIWHFTAVRSMVSRAGDWSRPDRGRHYLGSLVDPGAAESARRISGARVCH